ncbi:competence protein ComK [Lacticigenium naphthae]|uniref:competence protein ComK n=1 Tax=Lacticigenium naphthae TaxID=515351 RepID=UPI0003FB78F0|nr:competence protein ComK [Lacticigenium naphthae]
MDQDFLKEQGRGYLLAQQQNFQLTSDCVAEVVQAYPSSPFVYRLNGTRSVQPEHSVINERSVPDYLAVALEHNQFLINEETVYLLDLSTVSSCKYNTLIFQLHQLPIKTLEKTSSLLKRYFSVKKCSYEVVQWMGKSLGLTQRCPYVLGETMFVPNKGASRGSASWYAMHHVVSASSPTKKGVTQLNLRNVYTLELPVKKEQFSKQVQRVADLYYAQKCVACSWIEYFEWYSQPLKSVQQNIIHLYLAESEHAQKKFNLFELMTYLQYFKLQEILTKVFGSENPYIAEVMDYFKYSSPSKLMKDDPKETRKQSD